jgi:hypothetical protein
MPRGVPKAGFRNRGPNRATLAKLFKYGPNSDVLDRMMHVDHEETEVDVETDEEIETKLRDRFEILEDMTQAAIDGNARAIIVSGPPGLGKSYTVHEALERWDIDGHSHTVIKGYVKATGLFKLLYQHRHPGNVLVFDDADDLFKDGTCLNFLKAVCDTTKKRVVSYMSEGTLIDDESAERLPKSFQFDGTIIFITNYDFDQMIARGHMLAPHLEALVSRSHYIDLAMKTRRDYIVRIKMVAATGKLFHGLDDVAVKEVLEFIDENQDRLRELSLRMGLKIADIRRFNPVNWRKVALVTNCRPK